jgi:hypothetical protein
MGEQYSGVELGDKRQRAVQVPAYISNAVREPGGVLERSGERRPWKPRRLRMGPTQHHRFPSPACNSRHFQGVQTSFCVDWVVQRWQPCLPHAPRLCTFCASSEWENNPKSFRKPTKLQTLANPWQSGFLSRCVH